MLTVGSLFAGIGGFDLAAERVGFQVKWQVEIDDYCTRVLEKHWPHVRRYRDVREVHAPHVAHAVRQNKSEISASVDAIHEQRATKRGRSEQSASIGAGCRNFDRNDPEGNGWIVCDGCLPAVDLICGGFPCQPHSTAGRRLGAADERDLWPEFRRLIRELRPRWVVAENVPGLLSIDAGRFFGGILRDLAASGYDAEWDCLPASAVGAPHQRDRVWLIAYPNGAGIREQPERHQPNAAECGDAESIDAGALQPVADAHKRRREVERIAKPARVESARRREPDGCGEVWEQQHVSTVADATSERLENRTGLFSSGSAPLATVATCAHWAVEPDVGRVAHGIPARVDRLRGLGNAIVPQVAEWIFQQIKAAEKVTR